MMSKPKISVVNVEGWEMWEFKMESGKDNVKMCISQYQEIVKDPGQCHIFTLSFPNVTFTFLISHPSTFTTLIGF